MAKRTGVTFGELLRRLRTDAGLTQEELAEAASVSPRTISDLERGINLTARRDTGRLLADALGLVGPARVAFGAAARGRATADALLASGRVATRTLPRDIAGFTGRQRELAQLAETAMGTGGVVGIHAIDGMAGIGKTAFTVHAAHRLASRFPDGQVFLALHAHTAGQRPVDPADALASLLLTVGITAQQIPPGLEARMGLWRDHLAGKQVLLVLDDAASSDQVRPLLPGTAGSLVLITSRRHLTALEDAHEISLDTLPREDAAALLVRLCDRPGLDPSDLAVAELIDLCGHLPLAIGMVSSQLNHHPAWTPAALAAELAAARDRLALIRVENVSVAAAFDLSYQDLSSDQQGLFRRLGLHLGTTFDAHAAAALDGTSLDTARRGLEALYDQHLLTEPAHGRYRFHDLLGEHARTLAAADPNSDRDAALERLLDYYQHTAALAQRLLARHARTRVAPAVLPTPPVSVPSLPDRVRALAWTRTERANLFACLDHATGTRQHARVIALTAALAALLRQDGPWAEAIARHINAVQAARQIGDRLGEADALNDLGITRYATGDYRSATGSLEAALYIYHDLGDRQGEAGALNDAGLVRRLTGDYQSAAEAQEAALAIYRDLGYRLGQANALHELGAVRRLTGNYWNAAEMLEAALDICRDLGHRLGQASILNEMGIVRRLTEDYGGAAEAQEATLDICRDLGNRLGQANALNELGVVRRLTGDHRAAADALQAALGIYSDLGERGGEAQVLNEVGTLHRVCGELDQAEARHRQALALAREIDSSRDEAHALAGLGRCALSAGNTANAQIDLRQALEIFQQIGAAEAAGVATELDALTQPEPPTDK